MGFALNLVSEQTAVLLEKYFPNSKGKKNLARLFRCLAKCYKIMTSRCRHDSKDHMRSALGLELYYDVHILLSYFSTRITYYLLICKIIIVQKKNTSCKFWNTTFEFCVNYTEFGFMLLEFFKLAFCTSLLPYYLGTYLFCFISHHLDDKKL